MTHVPKAEELNPDHLRALYQISGLMNETLEFDRALDNVMDAIMQVTRAQRGFLMIVNEETNSLQVLVARGIDGETIQEEGYSTTIVGEVVKSREPLLTNNAQFDTRFNAGQSIIMRGLRAILCAPMLVGERLIGVVYVDTAMKAGAFTPSDQALMKAVSGQAARALENARLYQVAVEKGRLENELAYARRIQQSLLPQEMPHVKGYEIVSYWESAREVAGDFYDAFQLVDDQLGVVIADVSDKGAGAALFMAVSRTLIRGNAHAGLDPLTTISRANDLLVEDAESGMFVTVFHSVCRSNGYSVHVNAGHNPPILYRHATKTIEFFPKGGRALGWFKDVPLSALEVQLQAGDVILYYTDGLSEAENPAKDYYGEERLAHALLRSAHKSAQDIRDDIIKDVMAFCDGQPLFDDLTMVVVRYTG